jgi:hypothetical protein
MLGEYGQVWASRLPVTNVVNAALVL